MKTSQKQTVALSVMLNLFLFSSGYNYAQHVGGKQQHDQPTMMQMMHNMDGMVKNNEE